MFIKTGIAIIFSLLSACATVTQTYLPSGKTGYDIGCDGSAMGWDLCYNKAGDICKSRGYRVIQKSGGQSPLMVPKQDDYGNITKVEYSGNYVSRSMLIECK